MQTENAENFGNGFRGFGENAENLLLIPSRSIKVML